MSWEKEVEEIARRKGLAEGMGGPEKLARQKAQGKLNVRERITALADAGSFREIGKLGGAAKYDDDGNLTDFIR
jgi:acetyl-CoA carboxylase carboxyltransferase component